jgi:hypothetical protein
MLSQSIGKAFRMLLAWGALGACSGEIGAPAQPVSPGARPTGASPPAAPGKEPARDPSVPAPETGQRLTDRQYLNVVEDLFGVDASAEAAALPLDSKLEGFRNAGSALLPSDLRIEGYADLASAIATKIDWSRQLARWGGCSDFGGACQRAFLSAVGRRLFRRPLGDEQLARFAGVFAAVKNEGDAFPVAAALAVRAMLQSPEFLYRLEPVRGVDDFALATRLSFLLWNSTPDDALLDAAAGGALGTAAGARAQITRMLDDPRSRRALRDYVDDWLDVDKLPRTNRDPERFPLFDRALAADMREEIHRLFARVVWSERGDLLEVLRSERTELTPALAKLYGLPAPAPGGFGEQSLIGVPTRIGLLTQAGILTVTSVGSAGSSIVDRGVFLARNLLCRHLPEPPNNVPELPPAEQGGSERDRLAQHRAAPACAACHDQFDPLGLALESYDGIGAYQATDVKGNRLTGAGTLNVGGEEVPFTDVRGFVAALVREPAVEECLVRKAAQYTLARPLDPGDEAFVQQLAAGFRAGGRRYPALLAGLAQGAWTRAVGVAR